MRIIIGVLDQPSRIKHVSSRELLPAPPREERELRWLPAHGRPEIVMLFITIGVLGLSSVVGTFEIFSAMSYPSVILPKTGCFDAPGLNQSRLRLSATFMKNCEPPEFGCPVLAIDSVPGWLLSLEMFSSLMLPPPKRFSVAPVLRFLNVPSSGPPVPARLLLGSFAWGQPN